MSEATTVVAGTGTAACTAGDAVDPVNHLGLVHAIAKSFVPHHESQLPLADTDAFQEASLGLMIAARKCDPARAKAFGAYAGEYIRGRLKEMARRNGRGLPLDSMHVPRSSRSCSRLASVELADLVFVLINQFCPADYRLLVQRVHFDGMTVVGAARAEDPSLTAFQAQWRYRVAILAMRRGLKESLGLTQADVFGERVAA